MTSKTIMKNIADGWKLDARLEDMKRYFYNNEEVKAILENKKCYVIGRKGTGKTAICEYLIKSQTNKRFAEKLGFKNFPFNDLYSLSNQKFTQQNKYITLWKYLIYTTIAKMMSKNERIDSKIREELLKIYPENDYKQLSRKVSEWTSVGFGIDVLGTGGSLNLERQPSKNKISWIEKVDILEDLIAKYCDDSSYFVVFDELDEDYREITRDENLSQYQNLLVGLFKAVQDVKSIFVNTDHNIMPVVFLRDDIYAILNDPDKNKWSDLKINIEWESQSLKKLITYRIAQDARNSKLQNSFEDAWYSIFTRNAIPCGDKQAKHIDSFEFIQRSTQLRPRDFIKYIQACCVEALSKKEQYISVETIKHVDRAFSLYLKDEIIDEVYPLLPEIDLMFQILSNIRKQLLPVSEFINHYQDYIQQGTITQATNYKYVLEVLFNFSVIGNENKFKKGRHYFKYLQTNMTFNNDENIVIHRGLFKALQII